MKAILVMEMPSSCEDCPMLFAGTYCKGKKAPNIAVNSYLNKSKPDWCPLNPMPNNLKNQIGDTEWQEGFVDGFNSCIDEILGDKE